MPSLFEEQPWWTTAEPPTPILPPPLASLRQRQRTSRVKIP